MLDRLFGGRVIGGYVLQSFQNRSQTHIHRCEIRVHNKREGFGHVVVRGIPFPLAQVRELPALHAQLVVEELPVAPIGIIQRLRIYCAKLSEPLIEEALIIRAHGFIGDAQMVSALVIADLNRLVRVHIPVRVQEGIAEAALEICIRIRAHTGGLCAKGGQHEASAREHRAAQLNRHTVGSVHAPSPKGLLGHFAAA